MIAVARPDEEAISDTAILEEPDISASKVTEAEPAPDRCAVCRPRGQTDFQPYAANRLSAIPDGISGYMRVISSAIMIFSSVGCYIAAPSGYLMIQFTTLCKRSSVGEPEPAPVAKDFKARAGAQKYEFQAEVRTSPTSVMHL